MFLNDQTIVVTGSSEGLGEATAMRLAQEGAKVWLVARNERNLQEVTKAIQSSGLQADYCVCDIRSRTEVEKSVRRIVETDSKIDVLINNAGVWLQGRIQDASAEDVKRVFETNTIGAIFVTQLVLPVMLQKGSGHILNVISDSGVTPYADWAIYAASKYGLRGFTESLRKAVEGTQIKVTGFYPGGINTNLYSNAGIPVSSEPWMMQKTDITDVIFYILSRPKDLVIEQIVVTKLAIN